MRFRKKRYLLLLPAMVLVLATAAAVWVASSAGPRKPTSISRGDYTYATAFARHHVEQVMKRRHIPGAAVAMIDDQQLIWQASFGQANVEAETPVDDDTVFKLWSLAKPFTAIEIMRLVEEERLDLDRPLEAYVPGFSIRSRFPDRKPITLRHILAHRSGLPRNACRYGFGWEIGPDALARLAAALEDCYLAYPTGSRYKYSNVGYDTLGYIIQAERRRPYPAHMREQLLLPIGMTNSAFYSTDLPPDSEVAMGYEFYEGEYYPLEQLDVGVIPSGNLYASISDLATFIKFIFAGGEASDTRLIGPDTLGAMFEDQYSRPADPQTMGLGWKLGRVSESELLVWHDGGAVEGTGSLIAMIPGRKLAVVLVGNATTFEGGVSLPIAVEILEVMLETRYGLTVLERESAERIRVDPSLLGKYAGDYAAFGDVVEVRVDGEQLKGSANGMRFDLVPIAENRFRLGHWLLKLGLADLLHLPEGLDELEIAFQGGEGGASDEMIINFGGLNFEIGPRFPALPEGSAWRGIADKYGLYARLPSGLPGDEQLGESEITLVNHRLFMSGAVGPIQPIDDNTLIVLGGSFQGETITRDAATGHLFHQGLVFKPVMAAGTPEG